jgi:hypothetical protein
MHTLATHTHTHTPTHANIQTQTQTHYTHTHTHTYTHIDPRTHTCGIINTGDAYVPPTAPMLERANVPSPKSLSLNFP